MSFFGFPAPALAPATPAAAVAAVPGNAAVPIPIPSRGSSAMMMGLSGWDALSGSPSAGAAGVNILEQLLSRLSIGFSGGVYGGLGTSPSAAAAASSFSTSADSMWTSPFGNRSRTESFCSAASSISSTSSICPGLAVSPPIQRPFYGCPWSQSAKIVQKPSQPLPSLAVAPPPLPPLPPPRPLVGRDPGNPKSFASACVVLPPPPPPPAPPAAPAKQSSKNGASGEGSGGGGGGGGGGQKRQLTFISAGGNKVHSGVGGGGGGGGSNRTGGKQANNNNSSSGNFPPARCGGGGHRGHHHHRGSGGGKKSHQQGQQGVKRPPTKMECAFCRNISGPDGESGYKTHWLKDRQNVITCPKLRAYTCPLCLCPGGDKAHTKLYCPLKRQKLAEEYQRAKTEQAKKLTSYGGRLA